VKRDVIDIAELNAGVMDVHSFKSWVMSPRPTFCVRTSDWCAFPSLVARWLWDESVRGKFITRPLFGG
jgi:hypothetical protein